MGVPQIEMIDRLRPWLLYFVLKATKDDLEAEAEAGRERLAELLKVNKNITPKRPQSRKAPLNFKNVLPY